MSSYKDLSDNVDDSFDFTLRGNKYVMRYPKTGELEDIRVLNERLEGLDRTTDEGKAETKEISDKLSDAMYEYITPVDHELSIKDALNKENIKVLKNFNTMIKTELAV